MDLSLLADNMYQLPLLSSGLSHTTKHTQSPHTAPMHTSKVQDVLVQDLSFIHLRPSWSQPAFSLTRGRHSHTSPLIMGGPSAKKPHTECHRIPVQVAALPQTWQSHGSRWPLTFKPHHVSPHRGHCGVAALTA